MTGITHGAIKLLIIAAAAFAVIAGANFFLTGG
jgi:hypothetical protein